MGHTSAPARHPRASGRALPETIAVGYGTRPARARRPRKPPIPDTMEFRITTAPGDQQAVSAVIGETVTVDGAQQIRRPRSPDAGRPCFGLINHGGLRRALAEPAHSPGARRRQTHPIRPIRARVRTVRPRGGRLAAIPAPWRMVLPGPAPLRETPAGYEEAAGHHEAAGSRASRCLPCTAASSRAWNVAGRIDRNRRLHHHGRAVGDSCDCGTICWRSWEWPRRAGPRPARSPRRSRSGSGRTALPRARCRPGRLSVAEPCGRSKFVHISCMPISPSRRTTPSVRERGR
jgi:hypothetical protein